MALAPHLSPSEQTASDALYYARHTLVEFHLSGALSAAVLQKRVYFPCTGRIMAVRSFRRTAASGDGAAGSTDVDVNLNGTSILAATKMEHEQSGGNNSAVVGVMDTEHAAWDGHGIVVGPTDYLEVQVDAIEAGANAPQGLTVQVTFLAG